MIACPLGQVREHHATIGSTNDRALAWAREGAPHGAVVTADAQTAGRGRLGRVWASPPGGLYASVILKPEATALARGRFGAIGLAVGLGLREGLARWLPRASLKWPNDLLCGGRKLAGVLCETRWFAGNVDLVAGVGVNVEQRAFPDGLNATSVAIELAAGTGGPGHGAAGRAVPEQAPANGLAAGTGGLRADQEAVGEDSARMSEGACPTRQEVLEAALAGLEGVLADFFAGGFPAIRGRYQAHSAVLGRAVRIGDEVLEAVGFDDDGALRVRSGGGTRRVEAGDVWLAGDAGG